MISSTCELLETIFQAMSDFTEINTLTCSSIELKIYCITLHFDITVDGYGKEVEVEEEEEV